MRQQVKWNKKMRWLGIIMLLGLAPTNTLSLFAQTAQPMKTVTASTTSSQASNGDVVEAGSSVADAPSPKAVPGEILVKVADRKLGTELLNDQTKSRASQRLRAIMNKHAVSQLQPVFRYDSDSTAKTVLKLTSQNTSQTNTDELLADLRNDAGIIYAEPNYIITSHIFKIDDGNCCGSDGSPSAPNDPYYSSTGSWGQSYGDMWGLAKINAGDAWKYSEGSDQIVVGVVDTGIDFSHEDIRNQIATNLGETGIDGAGHDKRTNGVDDDTNGYIDDWRGWNFFSNNNNPNDDNGHGTHVAGTIGAAWNNTIGITGLCRSCRVLAVKGLDASGNGNLDVLAQAVHYAADQGVKVINASWGTSGPIAYINTLGDAVNYAHDVKGVTFVAAAGNSNIDVGTEQFGVAPANLRNAITVGASTTADQRASFSNYGAKIDVVAPGVDILSLRAAGTDIYGDGAHFVPPGNTTAKYYRANGTSMAAPHVAGAAALLLGHIPGLNADQVRQALRSTAADLGSAGFDSQFGYGRLNAVGTVNETNPAGVHLTGPRGSITNPSSTITGAITGSAVTSWELSYGSGSFPTSWNVITSGTGTMPNLNYVWDVSAIADGSYVLRLTGVANGKTYEDRLPVAIDNVVISSPLTGYIFRDASLTVSGTAAPTNFQSYQLIVRNGTGTIVNPPVTLPNNGTLPITNDTLATIDTSALSADWYSLELRVSLVGGGTISDQINVAHDSALHPGWPITLDAYCPGGLCYGLTNHMDVADVNGDGAAEILLGYGLSVRVMKADGSLLWERPTTTVVQQGPVVADIDRDGQPEVLVAAQNKIYGWRADGTSLPGFPFNPGGSFNRLTVDDLEGTTGPMELILTNWAGQVKVYDVANPPTVRWTTTISTTSTLLKKAAVGDVDLDGQKEILAATNGTVTLLNHDGSIRKTWTGITLGENNPILADVDGNGDLEVVVADNAFSASNTGVHVFNPEDPGSTELPGWPKTFSLPVGFNTPAVGDIDGDGQPEVVVGMSRSDEGSAFINRLFAWHANGTLLPGWPVTVSLETGHDRIFSYGFGAVAIANIDGDSLPEVIASSDSYSPLVTSLRAYHFDGTLVSGFPKPSSYTTAWPSNTAAVGDVDGDGLQELVWADYHLTDPKVHLYVWDLPTAVGSNSWPMFQHDPQQTGVSRLYP